MAMQGVFVLFSVVTLGGIVPFTYYGYQFTVLMKKTIPEGYQYPEFSDMWITAVSSVFWAIAEMTIHRMLIGPFGPLCKV